VGKRGDLPLLEDKDSVGFSEIVSLKTCPYESSPD